MKRITVFVLSVMMIFTMTPCISSGIEHDSGAKSGIQSEAQSVEKTDFGEPGETYEPGEIIVCVKGGPEALLASEAFDGTQKSSADNSDAGGTVSENSPENEGAAENAAGTSSSLKVQAAETEGAKGSFDGCRLTVEETLMNIEKEDSKELSEESEVLRIQSAESSKVQPYSIMLIKSSKRDVTDMIKNLEKLDCIEFAEPNMICKPTGYSEEDATGEPFFKYQWYSDKEKTNADYDLGAKNAYRKPEFTDSKEVVVAVMDSGVDYTHPDLKDSVWDKGEEYPELTELGGGKYGINTAGDSDIDDPMDSLIGHGTHCSSTIASTWKNKEGIAGINGNAKIMACRWMSMSGWTSDYIKAMNYVITAKEEGVNIVATNNSWGPSISTAYYGDAVRMVVDQAGIKGIVSCFAAGNSEINHDVFTNFKIDSPYVITVGAMDSTGNPAVFTDYGKRTVDVFAPGTQILAATSLQNTVTFMPPQYLPWLKKQGSFIYEDFENSEKTEKAITFEAYKYNPETGDTELTFGNDEEVCPGYGDNKARQIKLEGLKENDNIAFQINIPVSYFDELPDCEKFYMGFQAGKSGFDFDSVKGENIISRPQYLSGEWTGLSTGNRWRCPDDNWSSPNITIDEKTMQDMIAKAEGRDDKTVKIRFPMVIKKVGDAEPEIHIDVLGFGTKTSKYYYSDGTSMACPCAAAVTSLAAGNRNTIPDSGEDALDVIARVKGGVERNDKLQNKCCTGGSVQADSGYKNESELYPVPETVELKDDAKTAEISGHFFGAEEGSVLIDGKEAEIIQWSDNKIAVSIPSGIRYKTVEYTVTGKDGKNGRNFAAFKESQQGETEPVYEKIPTGDFTYESKGMKIKTEQLAPMKLAANDDGLLAILKEKDEELLALEFYSFKSRQWSKIDWPEEMVPKIYPFECFYSAAGAGDEFYLLMGDRSNLHLMTYSTSESKWLYDNKLPGSMLVEDPEYCLGETLGIIDGDDEAKLCISLGEEFADDTGIYQIFPDTGQLGEKISDTGDTLGDNHWGGLHLTSGETQILAGVNKGFPERASETAPYRKGAPCCNPVILKNGEWVKSDINFFDTAADEGTSDGLGGKGLDPDQIFIGAYGALDNGFIMAGPARDIDKDDMTDTWIYDADTDTYQGLECRLDTVKATMPAGVTHNGKFYVMAGSGENGKLFLKSLDLKSLGRTSTDCSHRADRGINDRYITAIGDIWLNEDNGGYYLKNKDGKLTHEGADENNYCVKYEQKTNKVTLNDCSFEGIQRSRRAACPAALFSNKDLIIELHGDNSLKPGGEVECGELMSGYGIYSTGDIRFTGDGNINVDSGDFGLYNTGISSEKDLVFDGTGSIDAAGQSLNSEAFDENNFYDMLTAGVSANEAVRINHGNITARGEDIDNENGTGSHASLGINTTSFAITGNASLKAVSGEIICKGDAESIAIWTDEKPVIGSGTVTTVTGEAEKTRKAYNIAPVLAPDTKTTTMKASVWFGKDEETALSREGKSIDVLAYHTDCAFTLIKAAEEKKKPEKIILKGTTIKKVKKLKRGFKAIWNRQEACAAERHITGYQLQYSLNSNFKGKSAKIKNAAGWKTDKKTIKKLKSRKKYYVRIRTYMKYGDQTYFSKWSSKKTVRVK